MIRMKMALVALAAVTALSLGATAGRRVTAVHAQTATAQVSPEEAVIALRPFILADKDVKAGYTLDVPHIDTVVTDAFFDSDPQAMFDSETKAGFIIDIHQTLKPQDTSSGLPTLELFVNLFADDASARAFAAGKALPPQSSQTLKIAPVTLTEPLGESSFAYHGVDTTPDLPPANFYTVRWSRGRIAYSALTDNDPGKEKLSDTLDFAVAHDKRVANLTLQFGSSTLTPPATEQQRLDALLRLKEADAQASQEPEGYSMTSSGAVHPAGIVATAGDPADALQAVDVRWKRIASISGTFTSTTDKALMLTYAIGLDADGAAAQVDATDYLPAPGESATPVDLGIQLGDVTAAFRVLGSNADGTPYEDLNISWTHGRVILVVNMQGAPDTTSFETLIALARQVDAAAAGLDGQ
jgi:hypothetical protein